LPRTVARIASRNSSARPHPCRFAVYIAMSAALSRSSAASGGSLGDTETPIDADTATDRSSIVRRGHDGDDPFGQAQGVAGARTRADDRELVAAQPSHDVVAGAHRPQQPVRDLAEQLVTRLVADGVLHRLEPVEIHEQHRGRGNLGGRAGGGEDLLQIVQQGPAVR